MSTMPATFTKILCGPCGGEFRYRAVATFECVGCGHVVTMGDLIPNMDEGEHLAASYGVLGYYIAPVGMV